MTIKDIAQIAGVSISTVSKIVNGKDQNINSDTRERVLKVVKEYNYSPYASVKNISTSKKFLLGVLAADTARIYPLYRGILNQARENGYQVILCDSRGSMEEELKQITALCRNGVDGVIWLPVSGESRANEKNFREFNIPVCYIGGEEGGFHLDYTQLGYEAASKLLEHKHKKIGCYITDTDEASGKILEGCQKCLFDHGIQAALLMDTVTPEQVYNGIILNELTGLICTKEEQALPLYLYLESKNLRLPEDFSVIGLIEDEGKPLYPRIPYIRVPFYELGKHVCQALVCQMESRKEAPAFDYTGKVENEAYIGIPSAVPNKKIVVVGSIHMDVTIDVDELPQDGKTVAARSCTMIPGGKGTNQAIGAARLGGKAALIGKVGKDYDGSVVMDLMNKNSVNIHGITKDDRLATGKAYIHVPKNGESSISIYAGANNYLDKTDIKANLPLLEEAGFCLLQTEIPVDTVEYTAVMARKLGVKVMLKPSALKSVSDKLIQNTDYFIPNRKELSVLCPKRKSLEEKAEYFLEKGAGTVIVTLGHKGCYLKSPEYSQYFQAADFQPVDTTGGADAFISALAVFLLEGCDIIKAIQNATCAAGFAVSRRGVVTALVDRGSLDLYLKK